MKVLGSDLKVGDVFSVNGDTFEIIEITDYPNLTDGRKMWFMSQTTGRKYLKVIWKDDSLLVV